MHQDHFRSVVHRSLSSKLPSRGQDGNETVQCGRIRASKTSHSVPAGQKIDGRGKQQAKPTNYRDRSESQQLQACRGARNLTQMTDSFHNVMGAMDLHDSLAMLEKIQSASKRMSYLSMKMKQELLEERVGKPLEVSVEASGSARYTGCGVASREPNVSAIDELKKVIRNSTFDDEKSSSSRSLGCLESKFSNSRSCKMKVEISGNVCPPDQANKARAPNLIAKLMGLEEIPSEFHPTRRREKTESITSPRASFDIGMPKSRKPQLREGSPDSSRKAMQEIIETMHFKGLLKADQAEEYRAHDHLPENLETLQNSVKSEKNHDLGHVDMLENKKEREEVKRIQKMKVDSHQLVKITACSSNNQKGKEMVKLHRRSSDEKKQIISVKKIEGKKERVTRRSPSNSEDTAELQHDRESCQNKCNLKYSSDPSKKNKPIQIKARKPVNSKVVTDQRSNKDGKAASSLTKKSRASTANSTSSCIDDYKMAARGIKACIEEDLGQDKTASSEVMPTRRKVEGVNSSGGEPTQVKMCKLHTRSTPRTEDEVTFMLLSSHSFLVHAQKLFGLDNYLPVDHQNKCAEEVGIRDQKLYLDIAEEIIGCKYYQQQQFIRPLLRTEARIRLPYLSLEELVDDATNSIARLKSYTDIKEDATSKDKLYMRMERDLQCTDTATSAVWDVGWVDRICVEEAGEVIDEVGEYIFFWLVEEACVDFVLHLKTFIKV